MKYRTLYFLLTQIFIFCCLSTFGQNYPVYNSYPTNLYLYNPAEAASEYATLFINHRRQWTGIEGAPQLSTVNFSTLLDQTRTGLGVKISSYKRGLLTTTDAQATFAYGIPVGKNDAFYFGLSGGLVSHSVDQSKITDPSDPAIANYLNNNIQPAASAGFVYKSTSGIHLGVILPQFIAQIPASNQLSASPSVNPFEQILFSVYYKKKTESRFVSRTVKGMRTRAKSAAGYAPLELYATYKLSAYQNSQFEVLAKVNLTQNFWVGAGYRQQYGFTASTGFAIKKFLLSYSFEPGSQPESGFSTGTHEIQLGLRFGEEKRLKRKAPVLRSALKASTPQQHSTRLQHSVSDPEKEEAMDQNKNAKKKFLVVIKVFSDFNQAELFKKKLIEQKFNAEIYYYAVDKKYYVHVLETLKSAEANEEVRNLKSYTKLKEAKVVIVQEK
ncbi:MAG: hypothetical protein DI538_24875 [Azospira oryzae]|jgi:type IX secretion system PorP/SprF family membrane protein|nr:MAG: hypothetical protein DI538_24875 [Azospira oryzae]